MAKHCCWKLSTLFIFKSLLWNIEGCCNNLVAPKCSDYNCVESDFIHYFWVLFCIKDVSLFQLMIDSLLIRSQIYTIHINCSIKSFNLKRLNFEQMNLKIDRNFKLYQHYSVGLSRFIWFVRERHIPILYSI